MGLVMAETRTYAELCHLIEDARLRMAHARTLELRLLWARRMLWLRKERNALPDPRRATSLLVMGAAVFS